jgi:hypothetical protein
MYIPEAPCNLVSEGKYFKNGLYLDAQRSIIHNGIVIAANYPRIDTSNVRVLEIHSDNETIDRELSPLFLAVKTSESLYEIWHQHLMHAGEETVV